MHNNANQNARHVLEKKKKKYERLRSFYFCHLRSRFFVRQ